MLEIKKLANKYKIDDRKITQQYRKLVKNFPQCKSVDTNILKIYEISFFYIITNTKIDYKYLEAEYRIKAGIFKNAQSEIKKYMEDEDFTMDIKKEKKNYVCNLYSIKNDINDYYE